MHFIYIIISDGSWKKYFNDKPPFPTSVTPLFTELLLPQLDLIFDESLAFLSGLEQVPVIPFAWKFRYFLTELIFTESELALAGLQLSDCWISGDSTDGARASELDEVEPIIFLFGSILMHFKHF